VPSQTRATLTTLTSLLIGDPANSQFSTTQVQDKIQEAQERFVLDTRVLTDNATDSIVDGTSEYNLPSDVLDIKRLAVNGIELDRVSRFQIDLEKAGNWSADAGTPQKFYVDLDPNNKKLRLYPIPQAGDVGTNNIAIEYIKLPPTLSADASVPLDGHTLLIAYQNALAYWAAKELLTINPSQENIARFSAYQKKYDDLVSHCIETFKHLAEDQRWRFRSVRDGRV
jgi:hypothetical protein